MKKKRSTSGRRRTDAVALNVADRIEGYRAQCNDGGGTDVEAAWELLEAAVSALVAAARTIRYQRRRLGNLHGLVADRDAAGDRLAERHDRTLRRKGA